MPDQNTSEARRFNLSILRGTLLNTSSLYAEEVRRHRANHARALRAQGSDEERTNALNQEWSRHDKATHRLPIASLTDVIVGLEAERKNVMEENIDCPLRRHRLDFLTRARFRLIWLAETAAKERDLFEDDAASDWAWMREAIKRGTELHRSEVAKQQEARRKRGDGEDVAGFLGTFRKLSADNKASLIRYMKFMLLHGYVHHAFLEEAQKNGHVDWYLDVCTRAVAEIQLPPAAQAEGPSTMIPSLGMTAIQASERLSGAVPLEEPAPTLETLTPNQRRFLDVLAELPEEEAERQMCQLALMSEAARTHGKIMDVARPEGMFSTYRKMLACHLSEVDDAIAAGQQPDAFTDTISAFQGEAEKALSLPAAPTVDMLEAGAGAAGIDIEQARAIYAAMAEAYKKDAA